MFLAILRKICDAGPNCARTIPTTIERNKQNESVFCIRVSDLALGSLRLVPNEQPP